MKTLFFSHAPLHRHPWFFHPMIIIKQLKLSNLKFVLFIEENKKKRKRKKEDNYEGGGRQKVGHR